MHDRLIAVVSALVTMVCLEQTVCAAQKETVICDGILAEIELETNRSFPTAVVYDHTDESNIGENAFNVAFGGKADIAFDGSNVR
jgi:hypothetical protein